MSKQPPHERHLFEFAGIMIVLTVLCVSVATALV
jgi:hypothetical protein